MRPMPMLKRKLNASGSACGGKLLRRHLGSSATGSRSSPGIERLPENERSEFRQNERSEFRQNERSEFRQNEAVSFIKM